MQASYNRFTQSSHPLDRAPKILSCSRPQDSLCLPLRALGFPGLGNGDYGFVPDSAPPDTTGAMGSTQYEYST